MGREGAAKIGVTEVGALELSLERTPLRRSAPTAPPGARSAPRSAGSPVGVGGWQQPRPQCGAGKGPQSV